MRKSFTDRTPPNRAKLAKIYDSHAPTWLRYGSRGETLLASEKWRDDLVAELQGDVLEIGLAAGDTLRRMAKYDHAVTSFTGIDISPGMVEQSRRAAEGLDVPIS